MKTINEIYYGKKNRSIINTLRSKYSSMEIAYLEETGNPIKNCIYCNEKSEFLSIFRGYKEICTSDLCKKKYFEFKNKKAINERSNLNKIFLKCWVCEKKEILVQNTKKNINKSIVCDSEYCKRNKNRSFLSERFILLDFRPDDISYMNKLAYSMMDLYKDPNKVRRILYKNFLVIGIEKPKEYIKNPVISNILRNDFNPIDYEITKDGLYYLFVKNRYRENLIKSLYGENFKKYVKEYYPDKIRKCSVCGSEYLFSSIFKVGRKKSEFTCSFKCYRKNFKIYMTDERRSKQSKSIKKRIQSGDFTPNIFNSMTKKI